MISMLLKPIGFVVVDRWGTELKFVIRKAYRRDDYLWCPASILGAWIVPVRDEWWLSLFLLRLEFMNPC